jgi:opacity protein-like surface antigen
MKKALLTLAVAVLALAAGAQAQDNTRKFNENTWVVGGTGNYTHDKTSIAGNNNSEQNMLRIEPFVGYQLNDRWRVGLTFGYGHVHYKENIAGVYTDLGGLNEYRVGPYVHFDIVKWKRWTLFAEAELFYMWSPETIPMDGDPMTGSLTPAVDPSYHFTVKTQIFSFTIKPGISFALDKCVNIDFNLNLLGWFYNNGRMEIVDSGNSGHAKGTEMTSHHTGFALDLLESSPADYWQKIGIGVTFKF